MGRSRSGAPLPLIFAGIFAVLLLIAGKAHFVPFERARAALSDRTAPLLQRLNTPIAAVGRWAAGIGHLFQVYSQNQQLREENARLLQWRGAALSLQERVNQYQRLLKAVPEPGFSAVTARVIARASQPFLQTIILNAGTQDGVRPGQAVVDARGMLGRIYVAGKHTSWVVLLDDLNSRIPVQVRPGNLQAILAGNNASEPSLEALPPRSQLKSDTEVVTSGDGGLLPPGLRVGMVVFAGREARVALYSDPASAEDVRILDFSAPVESLPKPSDRDLPAPATLSPPPTASVAEENTPAKIAPAPQTSGRHASPAVRITPPSPPKHAEVHVIRPSHPQAEPPRQAPSDDQTDEQTNQ